jgi:HlyD family secretion protein
MKTTTLCFFLAVSIPTLITNSGCGHAADTKAVASQQGESPVSTARVTVGKPQRKTLIVSTTQPARIEAFENTPVFSKLAGYVNKVHVDIGDKVSRDQTLVTLHEPELLDVVQQKTALVAQAEAQLKQAATTIDAAKAAVDTADAKVAEANAGATRANSEGERWKSEYGRVKELAANGSVTAKLADETLNQLRASDASREAAEAAIKTAKAAAREARVNVDKAEADHAAADARVSVTKADLAHSKTMVDYATMRSPFDGVVTKRSVDTGHFVQPATGSGGPLLVVARTDQVRVFVDIPELEAASVNNGDPATIRIQAMPGKTISAPVTRTSWSLDSANRSLRAEIDVPNTEALLRPGMYANVTIEQDHRSNALVIPITALFNKNNESYVCCVVSGKAAIKPVRLGIRSGQEIEVVNGLDEDSVIVLAQADRLVHDQQVETVNKL